MDSRQRAPALNIGKCTNTRRTRKEEACGRLDVEWRPRSTGVATSVPPGLGRSAGPQGGPCRLCSSACSCMLLRSADPPSDSVPYMLWRVFMEWVGRAGESENCINWFRGEGGFELGVFTLNLAADVDLPPL